MGPEEKSDTSVSITAPLDMDDVSCLFGDVVDDENGPQRYGGKGRKGRRPLVLTRQALIT